MEFAPSLTFNGIILNCVGEPDETDLFNVADAIFQFKLSK